MKFFFKILFFLSVFSSGAQVDSVFYGKQPPVRRTEHKKEPKDDKWKEKFNWGTNFQAWISNPTFVYLAPTVGYIPIKNANIGVGLVYNFTSLQSSYGSYSQSIFGGHCYARYVIAENYFVQAQFDKLHQPDLFSPDPNQKTWVDYFLVGGGFRRSISDKVVLTTSLMYNLTPSLLSIYPSRLIIQFGIVGRF